MRFVSARTTPVALSVSAAIVAVACARAPVVATQVPATPPPTTSTPATEWERVGKPETVGYDSARLEALRGWLRVLDTTAMMAVVGGRSLFEYGDLTRVSYLVSVRKSLLAMLYGTYVENGTITLERTLRALELTDVGGLEPQDTRDVSPHRAGEARRAVGLGEYDTALRLLIAARCPGGTCR